MSNLMHCSTWKAAMFLGILLTAAKAAPAQALATAQRGPELTPFVQSAMIDPDWGGGHNLGYTVGLDYTRFIRSMVQPSLELRMSTANGNTVGERSYLGGFKLQTSFHAIHPYATILGGNGVITFAHPANGYRNDSSFVLSLGAGADVNVTSQWLVRVDFTHQQWDLEPGTLTPVTLGVGIAYRIPLHGGGRVE